MSNVYLMNIIIYPEDYNNISSNNTSSNNTTNTTSNTTTTDNLNQTINETYLSTDSYYLMLLKNAKSKLTAKITEITMKGQVTIEFSKDLMVIDDLSKYSMRRAMII